MLPQRLHHGFLLAPKLTRYEPPPAPSLSFGETGVLLAAEAILADGSQRAGSMSVPATGSPASRSRC